MEPDQRQVCGLEQCDEAPPDRLVPGGAVGASEDQAGVRPRRAEGLRSLGLVTADGAEHVGGDLVERDRSSTAQAAGGAAREPPGVEEDLAAVGCDRRHTSLLLK